MKAPANSADPASPDVWLQWLLHDRHAGDEQYRFLVRKSVEGFVDRVLDLAQLTPGIRMVDVESGDGSVAFRAIDRIGPSLSVGLTDISEPLLEHAKAEATRRSVSHQCTFSPCSAENLWSVEDNSTDLVTTRAVLAYVQDKAAAFREFHRILKPGGRISIAEPILQEEAWYACELRRRVNEAAARPHESPDPFLPLLHRWKAAQFPDTEELCARSPIANFGERDLLSLAKIHGFRELHLELHIDEKPQFSCNWDVFLGVSPHPWAPTLKRILADRFSPAERALFEQFMRPGVEAGKGITIERVAYLTAIKGH